MRNKESLAEINVDLRAKIEMLEIENMNLKSVPAVLLSTTELVEALKGREGVTFLQIENGSRIKFDSEGSETILRIID